MLSTGSSDHVRLLWIFENMKVFRQFMFPCNYLTTVSLKGVVIDDGYLSCYLSKKKKIIKKEKRDLTWGVRWVRCLLTVGRAGAWDSGWRSRNGSRMTLQNWPSRELLVWLHVGSWSLRKSVCPLLLSPLKPLPGVLKQLLCSGISCLSCDSWQDCCQHC